MKKNMKKSAYLIAAWMMFFIINIQAVSAAVNVDLRFGRQQSSYNPYGSNTYPGGGGLDLSNSYGLPTGSITGIITNLLDWLLAMFAIFGIIGFVIAGILYLTSAGDEGQIDRAKTAMTYSIIGVLVGLVGFVVLQAVHGFLSQDSQF